MARGESNTAVRLAAYAISTSLIVLGMQYAQALLLPLSLAVLLSFLLSPTVFWLEKVGLNRVLAVIATTVVTGAAVVAFGWLLTEQLSSFSTQSPSYQKNLRTKYQSVVQFGQSQVSATEKWLRMATGKRRVLSAPVPTAAPGEQGNTLSTQVTPGPAVVPPSEETAMLPLQLLQDVTNWLFVFLGTATVVCVLTIFILIHQNDLRDRCLRLIGESHVVDTTTALDEAAAKVSRYLRLNLMTNCIYASLLSLGLAFFGIPNALLWGMLAAIFRFIPYVGAFAGIIPPFLLSLAVLPGWALPLLLLAMTLVLDFCVANFVEPLVYGKGVGISSVTLIFATLFWTWIWGLPGLLLATPLTVCLFVLGRHTPGLEIIAVLFSEQPALEPAARLYHRLLVLQDNEAMKIIDEKKEEAKTSEVYEQLFVPVLISAHRDFTRGRLSEERYKSILDRIRNYVEDLSIGIEEDYADSEKRTEKIEVAIVPVRHEVDEIAALMCAQLLAAKGYEPKLLPINALPGEIIQHIKQHRSGAVVFSAMPLGTALTVRHLLKRLATNFSDLPTILGLWHGNETDVKLVAGEIGASRRLALAFGAVPEQLENLAVTSSPPADKLRSIPN